MHAKRSPHFPLIFAKLWGRGAATHTLFARRSPLHLSCEPGATILALREHDAASLPQTRPRRARLPHGWAAAIWPPLLPLAERVARRARLSLHTNGRRRARALSRLVCARARHFLAMCCDDCARARDRAVQKASFPCIFHIALFSLLCTTVFLATAEFGRRHCFCFFFSVCEMLMLTTTPTSDGRARAVITPNRRVSKGLVSPPHHPPFCPGSATAPPLRRHDTQRTATHRLLFSALSLLHRIFVGNTHAHAQTFSCKDAQ
jgi:hypothetical protein